MTTTEFQVPQRAFSVKNAMFGWALDRTVSKDFTLVTVKWDNGLIEQAKELNGKHGHIKVFRKFNGSRFENDTIKFRRKIKDMKNGSYTIAITELKRYSVQRFYCEQIGDEIEISVPI
ncbi:MAG: hypothetical protein ACW98K_11545 [Candidatus Kariarchaeaceae archaeon]|jgi:hypothetical protein